MEILKYSLGQLQTNCYFLAKGNNCLLIDPADEASFILEELQRRKLNLVGILATHGHFDHIGAVGEIQLTHKVPFYIFKKDQFLVDRLNETAKHFLDFNPHFLSPTTVKYLTEKELKINPPAGGFKLKIIPTPGHTPGGCSFYLPAEALAKEGLPILFSGDTLFKQGIGRYDFSYCNKSDLKKSLEKLLKLPKNTKVLSGHGEETTIGSETDFLKEFLSHF